MLLDYLHTHPNVTIRYYKLDMILYLDSDAAYLVAPKLKSRYAGFYYLGNKYTLASLQTTNLNGGVHIEC